MSTDTAMLPAVAPGIWTEVRNADSTREVHVTFESAHNVSALVLQLDKWNSALSQANCPGVALPHYVRRDATPMLHFAAPVHVGSKSPAVSDRAAIVATLRSVALALDSLHAHGLVHGALAFPSLWWNANNQVQFPDVGLAHALDGIAPSSADIYNYRAPELWHGRAQLPASDQYSLAVMAYELFTGRARGSSAMVEGLVSIEPIMLEPKALQDAGAPIGIAEILQRALSATPASRYGNCVDLIEAVAAQFGEDGLDRFADRRNRPRRRFTTGMIAASVTAITIIGGAAYTATHQDETRALVARTQAGVRDKIERKSGLLVPVSGTTTERPSSATGEAVRRAEQMARTTIESKAAAAATAQSNARSSTLQRGQLFSDVIRGPNPLPPPQREFANAPQLESDFNIAANSAFTDAARNVSEFAISLVAELDSMAPSLSNMGEELRRASLNGAATAVLDAVRPGERGTNAGAGSTQRAIGSAVASGANSAGLAGAAAAGAVAASTSKPGTLAAVTGNSSPPVSSAVAERGTASPSAAPPTRSTLGVISFTIPESSRLYIDGQLIRQRVKPVLVEPGIHDVVVLTENGGSVRRRLTIAAGDTAFVRVP